ncbi:DUF1015 domain-containing protein [Anaerolinea sp.]|nr:DUF1015 domain-containing protein [uncultured Anaerolinea sp.]
MRRYLNEGIFVSHHGLILVERQSSGRMRHGLMMALDLEHYDYSAGSQTLIRATEGTILDRLPPRMRIREGAPLELPHILVLIDDPQQTVIEPLVEARKKFSRLYDTDLMFDSGHLTAWAVPDGPCEEQVISALRALANPETFRSRYGVGEDKGVLLFAMGDGNHSLATAKAIWEKIKGQVGMNHPARYALVEIENVHDHGLEFEPIHRVLFQCKESPAEALKQFFGDTVQISPIEHAAAMIEQVKHPSSPLQTIGMVTAEGYALVTFTRPTSNLPVGTLQGFLDAWLKSGSAAKIDYVHGDDVVVRLGSQLGNVGFYLPAISKHDLFKTVILDGVLPRKTFSMGEARDKRFYMEARRIA